MGSTWFIQFNGHHVYSRLSGCMIKKTVTSRIILVVLHTHCKCFEETAQITILSELFHISRKLNFASCFLSVHGKMTYAIEINCFRWFVSNNKGADQTAHPRSLISNFVIITYIYLDWLRAKLQFSCEPVKPRRLVWDSLCRKPRRQVFSRRCLLYFCCLLDSSRTNIASATDNNVSYLANLTSDGRRKLQNL